MIENMRYVNYVKINIIKIKEAFKECDLGLFIFLIINPILNDIGFIFPMIYFFIPNNMIAIIRLLLIGFSIYKVNSKMNVLSISVMLFIAVSIVLSSLNIANYEMIKQIFLNGEFICALSLFLYFSMNINIKKVRTTFLYASYIIVPCGVLGAAIGFYGSWSEFRYMDFSHNIILYWTIILQYAFINKGKIHIFFSFVFGLIIMFLSNRAIIINIIVSLLIFSFIYLNINKLKIKKGVKIATFLSAFVLLFSKSIIALISKVLALFNLNSYSIISLNLGSFFESSSRLKIWSNAFEQIAKKPLNGWGIAADRVYNGNVALYSHNIFLELWVDFGLFVGTGIIVTILYSFFILTFKEKNEIRDLFLPFGITTCTILLLSKSLYILPEFWISIAIACNYFSFKIKNKPKINLKFKYKL